MPRGAISELPLSSPRLKPAEFRRIQQLAYDNFGLDLKPGKEELVSARLGKKLRLGGFRSFDDYCQHVMADTSGESLIALIDALTTNYTSFLRERAHFEFLRDTVLPEFAGARDFRLWCAACSTGEEPYSLSFYLESALARTPHSWRMVATDISTRALGVAARAVYPEDRLRDVPDNWRRQYLRKGAGTAEGYFRVRDEIRQRIEFRRLNLIERISHTGAFPVIFCRNVMIYFNQQTREHVVGKMLDWLEPGGYLFVGHSESLANSSHGLQYVRPAVYRKKDGGGAGTRKRATR